MTDEENERICAVIIGQAASAKEASDVAANYRLCPYSAFYGTEGLNVIGLLVLPSHKRWWAMIPQEDPHLLGLEKANVILSDAALLQSPWSRREVKPVREVSPCGAKCPDCPFYPSDCEGCPATIWSAHT